MIVVAVIVIPSPRISGPWVMQKAECLQRVRSVNNSPFPSVGYHGMILNNFFFSGMLKKDSCMVGEMRAKGPFKDSTFYNNTAFLGHLNTCARRQCRPFFRS